MKRKTILCVMAVVFFPLVIQAGPVTALRPLSELSPGKTQLEWTATEPVANATTTIYCRKMEKGVPGVWYTAPELSVYAATHCIFAGTHGEVLQLRSAMTTPASREMLTLADFDANRDIGMVGLVATEFGFKGSYGFDFESSFQGKSCMRVTLSREKEKNNLPKDALVGLPFSDAIPTSDWSSYRYLEFYYWGDVPGGARLYIQSASHELQAPVYRFSETGDSLRAWHSIVVDLDKEFAPPEARSKIEAFAFVIPIPEFNGNKPYTFKLDAVRLWADRSIVQTRFDATPPTPPTHLWHELGTDTITWSWEASKEDLSEVVGYAFSFGPDGNAVPPSRVMTHETSVSIPYRTPPNYMIYFFKVRAYNSAGAWSDIAWKVMETFPPKN